MVLAVNAAIKIATALFFIMIPPEFSIFEFLSASYFFGLV